MLSWRSHVRKIQVSSKAVKKMDTTTIITINDKFVKMLTERVMVGGLNSTECRALGLNYKRFKVKGWTTEILNKEFTMLQKLRYMACCGKRVNTSKKEIAELNKRIKITDLEILIKLAYNNYRNICSNETLSKPLSTYSNKMQSEIEANNLLEEHKRMQEYFKKNGNRRSRKKKK